MEKHVYIYGDIYSDQSDFNSMYGSVSLNDVKKSLEGFNKDTDSIVAHIHSPGGHVDEGFAIHDYLVSLTSDITTIVEGTAYSIAVVVALAGTKRISTENSKWLLHLPSGGVYGNTEDIENYLDYLNKEKKRIADFVSSKTNYSSDEVLEKMKDETYFNSDEAKDMGLATEVSKGMKAAAWVNEEKVKRLSNNKVNNNNKNENSKDMADTQNSHKELTEAINKNTGILDKISGLFKSNEKPTMLELTTADGTVINFDTSKNDNKDSVIAGNSASIENGKIEDKTYLMANKSEIVIKAGKVESVKDVAEDHSSGDDASEKRLAELERENKELAKNLEQMSLAITKMTETLSTVAENIHSDTNLGGRQFENNNGASNEEFTSSASMAIAKMKAREAAAEAKAKAENSKK